MGNNDFVRGIEKFTKDIKKGLNRMDGRLPKVEFDPDDPQSIKSAISKVEKDIDAKAGNDKISMVVAKQLKEQARNKILERVKELQRKNKK